VRIPSVKAAPPPPPATKAPKPKKKAAKSKGKSVEKPREESTEVLEVSSDSLALPSLPPSPPKPAPHLVQIYGVVTIDGKECGTVNNIIDINDDDIFSEKKYDWLAELAWEKIKTYCSKRGGHRGVYKANWKASFGAERDKQRCDLNSTSDWEILEELLRHRAKTHGLKNASKVDIPLYFKTHGNTDSSPLPQSQVQGQGKTGGRNKANPSTIRAVDHTHTSRGVGENEEEEDEALPAEPALPKSRKRATTEQLRQRASSVAKESELASYQRAISEEWWCKDPLCRNHDKGSCFIRQIHDHYILTNDILTIWARDLIKGETGVSLTFPGLTCLGLLHSAGMAKRLAQKRAPRPETAMQTALQGQPLQMAASQSPAVPAVHMHFPSPYPSAYSSAYPSAYPQFTPPPLPPTQPITAPIHHDIRQSVETRSSQYSSRFSSTPALLSSPIKGADEDEILDSFVDWLQPILQTNRLQLVRQGVDILKAAGFTLQELKEEPSEVFDQLGVKAAALLSMKKNISEFKRQYKMSQAAQQLTTLSQEGRYTVEEEEEEEEEEEGREGER
jgi:hypothetical protein